MIAGRAYNGACIFSMTMTALKKSNQNDYSSVRMRRRTGRGSLRRGSSVRYFNDLGLIDIRAAGLKSVGSIRVGAVHISQFFLLDNSV